MSSLTVSLTVNYKGVHKRIGFFQLYGLQCCNNCHTTVSRGKPMGGVSCTIRDGEKDL